MTEWQVFLNGGIGVSALCLVWLISKHQSKLYADMMKEFMKSVVDEMKETTIAVKELAAEIRKEK